MSAPRGAPRVPPRPLVRTLWSAHRALVRLSGGRIGLSDPASGARFGLLRLHTIGRRTGERRVAIVGYFEDGSDIVTLAMNGWAEAEPAWWSNLRAQPDASVDLVSGSQLVRARQAGPHERERLWTAAKAYSGWGADLDGLATRRTRETAVVILERRGAPAEGPA